MPIDVRILDADEATVLENVDPDVFDNPVDAAWSEAFLADPRHHLAVALDADTVVGMASAVDYAHPDKPVELWINEVGVASAYQRQGIGRRLLEALFEHARAIGCREAWVATEPDNGPARALYQAVEGEEESAIVYTFTL